MDCSVCTLPSHFPEIGQSIQKEKNCHIHMVTSDDDDAFIHRLDKFAIFSVRKIQVELNLLEHSRSDVMCTVSAKWSMKSESQRSRLPFGGVARGSRSFVIHSAHEAPPALAVLGEIEYYPYNLYSIMAYEKLHIFKFGLIHLLCNMTNDYLRLY